MESIFKKVYPIKNISSLFIHHLPNKYINKGGVWENPGAMTEKMLVKRISRSI
jgi:hypothetical protein